MWTDQGNDPTPVEAESGAVEACSLRDCDHRAFAWYGLGALNNGPTPTTALYIALYEKVGLTLLCHCHALAIHGTGFGAPCEHPDG